MTILQLASACLLLLLAGGCTGGVFGGRTAAGDGELSGTLAYRERIALFPNAIARVRLAEHVPSGEIRIIADTTLTELSGVPVPFALRYRRGPVAEATYYVVEGELLEPFGGVVWSGSEFVALSGNDPVDILLRYVYDDGAPMRTTYFYHCQGLDLIVRVRGGEIGLMFPDTTYVLSQVPSASGARFSEGDITFWTKGDEAVLEMNGNTYRECRSDPVRAVWEDFRLRGARFRGAGNEPGWSLVVYDDPSRAELEVDEQTFSFMEMTATSTADGRMRYEGWGDGHTFSAEVRLQPCAGPMSGEQSEWSVTLTLDGREYKGCGGFLKDRR